MLNKMPSLPNTLTLFRLLTLPFLVMIFYLDSPTWHWVAFVLFALSAFTDFLDGYIARKYSLSTNIGKLLDTVADKLLVISMLISIMMRDYDKGIIIPIFIPTIIIVCREVIISAMREFISGSAEKLSTTKTARVKTFIQFIAIGFLIVGNAGPTLFNISTTQAGVLLIWIAGLLTLYTGYDYAIKTYKTAKNK